MTKLKTILSRIIFATKINKVYYFAYGSNMSLDRITKRIGYCKRIGKYELEGYKLSFNYGNENYTFANLIEDSNSSTEGVVYEITREQLELLDYSEGRSNPSYYQRMIDLFKGKPLHFYISFNIRNEFEKPISEDYFNSLLDGVNENDLLNYKSLLLNTTQSHINGTFMYK